MNWRYVSRASGLLLAITISHLPALAQFGIGFGVWNWGGHHSGGYGGWFGTSLWPNRSQPSVPPRSPELHRQANGYLEGFLTVRNVCPANQPEVACPILSIPPNDITISAEPYGAKQWITSHPDANGHYRLVLPPGGYNLSIHHPQLETSDQILRQIIIQPGKTHWQNFQIDHPLQ